jgi:hypothetical protein
VPRSNCPTSVQQHVDRAQSRHQSQSTLNNAGFAKNNYPLYTNSRTRWHSVSGHVPHIPHAGTHLPPELRGRATHVVDDTLHRSAGSLVQLRAVLNLRTCHVRQPRAYVSTINNHAPHNPTRTTNALDEQHLAQRTTSVAANQQSCTYRHGHAPSMRGTQCAAASLACGSSAPAPQSLAPGEYPRPPAQRIQTHIYPQTQCTQRASAPARLQRNGAAPCRNRRFRGQWP